MNILHEVPDVGEYMEMRRGAASEEVGEAAAAAALERTIFAVTARGEEAELIGMGRIVGDGGCCFQIADVMATPSRRGQGIERAIMAELTAYLDRHAPKGASVLLMADLGSLSLYKSFGFELTYPNLMSMSRQG